MTNYLEPFAGVNPGLTNYKNYSGEEKATWLNLISYSQSMDR